MMPTPYEAWVLARLISGQPLNGELAALSEAWRPLAERLAATPLENRASILDGFLIGRPDRDVIIDAIADQHGKGPPPTAAAPTRCYATLGDIAQIVSSQPWLWRGWIASGVLNAMAADPGTGKTRYRARSRPQALDCIVLAG